MRNTSDILYCHECWIMEADGSEEPDLLGGFCVYVCVYGLHGDSG